MEHPFTLHEDDDARVVQLSGSYYTGFGTSIGELKVVFFTLGTIELHQLKTDDGGKATQLILTSDEANNLFTAWETFKAEQELKKLVEQKRLADVEAEAYALVDGLPIEIITEPEPGTQNPCNWRIHSDTINTIRYRAYHPDQLLERTKMAVKDYERHQVEQRIRDEIAAIKRECPAIKIRGHHAPWHVVIETPDLYGEYAMTLEEMLTHVKAAKAKHEQWQQDELIKSND